MSFCSKCGSEVNAVYCPKCGTPLSKDNGTAEIEKGNLLNLLYLLRAGISRLSIKCDEARKEENEYNLIQKRLNDRSEYIKKLKKERAEENQKIINISNEEIDKIRKEYAKKIKEAEIKDKKEDVLRTVFKTFAIIFGIISILCIPVALSISNKVSWIPLLVLLGCVVIAIISMILSSKYNGKSAYRLRKQISEKLDAYDKSQKAETKARYCMIQIEKAKEDIPRIQNELIAPKTKISNIQEESKKIYNALENAFGELLHPNDWENLDIIIYCLESHRASSLTEALQQTDLIVRHEELKSVMADIGKQICTTITSFALSLSWQLDTIADNQKNITDKLQNINDNLISSAEMQKALLTKSNENSKRLMEDVRIVRSYADIMAKEKNMSL